MGQSTVEGTSREGRTGWAARARSVSLWIATSLAALLMAGAGASKFANRELWTGMFADWGYPEPFAFVVGALEVGLAALMLVPRLASYAAGALAVVMVGALGTVIVRDSELGVAAPIVNLALLTIVGYGRWGLRWRRNRPTDG